MPSALQTATLQSAILSITSGILAQLLTSYRSSSLLDNASLLNPLGLNYVPILQMLVFTLLSTPPNFQWQVYLERTFPGYPTDKGKQKLKVDDDGNVSGSNRQTNWGHGRPDQGVVVEKKLDIRNTAIKFLLDQSLGASVNTAAFLMVVTALKGGTFGACVDAVRSECWPIMVAGYKLWPLVSIANFTVVPVERRTLVGSIVGLGWGVFMALRITDEP